VKSESRYGTGRGRIGNRYFLLKEAFQELLQNREIERSDNLSPKSKHREIERSDTVSPESQNRMNTRSDNLSPERLKCHPRHDSSDNDDISEQVPLKEHARINHHHQSSDARDNSDVVTDDDDDQKLYRRVNVEQLFRGVEELAGYDHDVGLVRGAIDVVLDRATGRVANPTAYVRKALVDDLYGVMATAMQNSPFVMGQPQSRRSRAFAAANNGSSLSVVEYDPKADFEAPSLEHDHLAVPQVSELSADAVPCTNLDHLQSYEMTARQLADCNYCRVEQKLQATDQDGGYRHVADATDAQIAGLSHRVQQWVAQFRASDGVDKVS